MLRGSPARQSGGMCMRITIAERAKPMGFCNTYVGGGPGRPASSARRRSPTSARPMRPARRLRVRLLHVKSSSIDLRARRGLSQAFLLGVRGPARRAPRHGSTASRRMLRRAGGAKLTRTREASTSRRGARRGFRAARLPRHAGRHLRRPSDSELAIVLGFDSAAVGRARRGRARSPALAHAIAKLHRYDGVTADFAAPAASSRAAASSATRPAGQRHGALQRAPDPTR